MVGILVGHVAFHLWSTPTCLRLKDFAGIVYKLVSYTETMKLPKRQDARPSNQTVQDEQDMVK